MSDKLQMIKDYREKDALNQSFLKKVLINDTRPEETGGTKPHFAKGNLVDCLITTPELIDEIYYISSIPKYPTEAIKEIVDKVYESTALADYDSFDAFQLKDYGSLILELSYEYQSNWKWETKLKKIIEEGYDYWNELIVSRTRTIIPQDYYWQCQKVATSLLTHPFTKHYFEEDMFRKIKYQEPIYWTYQDVVEGWQYNCKGLLDMLVFDEANMTVQIIDIKTTGEHLSSWKRNVARKYNYAFQLSFYYYGIMKLFPEYRQLNPLLLVENIDYPGKPRIFELTLEDLYVGQYGAERQKSTIIYDRDNLGNQLNVDFEVDRICGWTEAIEILHQSKQLGLTDYDISYFHNQGKSNLNLFL